MSQPSVNSNFWDGFLPDIIAQLSSEELAYFTNKRILITGGGGYLGSALAHALCALPIAELVLLDQAEYGLYRLDQDFHDAGLSTPVSLIVGSVTDRRLLDEIFESHAPDIVFHAAALKHVPLMQSNAIAAVETNIIGTDTVIEAAMRSSCNRLIALSTDKSVHPISVMGATKRVAEQLVLQAHRQHPARVTAVRLCNVLGSTGSVAPMFAWQIEAKQPLTITHPETTRFFISPKDAVRCLLRAATSASKTGIFVPSLTEPHRVSDLADYMLRRADSREKLVEIGLREGDKLHEQIFARTETAYPTALPGLLSVETAFNETAFPVAMTLIRTALVSRNVDNLRRAINPLADFELAAQTAAEAGVLV